MDPDSIEIKCMTTSMIHGYKNKVRIKEHPKRQKLTNSEVNLYESP